MAKLRRAHDSRLGTSSPRAPKTSAERSRDSVTIATALAEMAYLRGSPAPPEYLEVFSRRLAREYLPGVLASLELLSARPRREGETALPDLGTILTNRPIRPTLQATEDEP